MLYLMCQQSPPGMRSLPRSPLLHISHFICELFELLINVLSKGFFGCIFLAWSCGNYFAASCVIVMIDSEFDMLKSLKPILFSFFTLCFLQFPSFDQM